MKASIGLNPCSNGRYSRRMDKHLKSIQNQVLILVLMEDTLGDNIKCYRTDTSTRSLNPCSNGRYSRRVRGVKALFQERGE